MDTLKNVDINVSTKQQFTVDNDQNKIIELDTGDYSIIGRLTEATDKIKLIGKQWEELLAKTTGDKESADEFNLDDAKTFSAGFGEMETSMRNLIDYIFDSPGLADTVLGSSSAFALTNGQYKYNKIISALTGLYEESIKKETDKLNKSMVNKKVSKYIK